MDDFVAYYNAVYVLSAGVLQYYESSVTPTNDFNYGKPMTGVKKITAYGSDSRYALKQDGSVWAWGQNGWGQLGDGTTTYHSQAVQVDISEKVVDVVGLKKLRCVPDRER